jgi:hypothetical protein
MNIDSTSRFIIKLAQVPRASIAGHSPDALYKKSGERPNEKGRQPDRVFYQLLPRHVISAIVLAESNNIKNNFFVGINNERVAL